MRNFQDTFEIRKQSFISAFSVCMTVPLIYLEWTPQTYIFINVMLAKDILSDFVKFNV